MSLVQLTAAPTDPHAPRKLIRTKGMSPDERCGCGCGNTGQFRQRFLDVGISLAGAMGWLAVPKCPLCLTAYISIVTGVSLTSLTARSLLCFISLFAAILVVSGLVRLGRNAIQKSESN